MGNGNGEWEWGIGNGEWGMGLAQVDGQRIRTGGPPEKQIADAGARTIIEIVRP
jgi:hypothetical protein